MSDLFTDASRWADATAELSVLSTATLQVTLAAKPT